MGRFARAVAVVGLGLAASSCGQSDQSSVVTPESPSLPAVELPAVELPAAEQPAVEQPVVVEAQTDDPYNVYAGLQLGIATFDGSAGGLGGCPYAPGAAGNLPTEDLVYFLDRLDIETGVDLLEVVKATRIIAPHVGHALASKQCRRLASWPEA